jgi:two-component system LytT family response regulator
MKALIIEDEISASNALKSLIFEVSPDIEIIAQLQSIDESIEWFSTHANPDLAFMDIHLADGSSFSIFESVEVHCPVIFTTAYDEYALKAFEVNSIGYLLKPIDKQKLLKTIQKYREFIPAMNRDILSELMLSLKKPLSPYKTHFLIPKKDKLIPLQVENIAFVFTENKIVKAYTFSGDFFILNYTLEELSDMLNPVFFFRANRQFLVSHKAIKDISLWFNSKLSVNLVLPVPEKILISKARVPEFKAWYMEQK